MLTRNVRPKRQLSSRFAQGAELCVVTTFKFCISLAVLHHWHQLSSSLDQCVAAAAVGARESTLQAAAISISQSPDPVLTAISSISSPSLSSSLAAALPMSAGSAVRGLHPPTDSVASLVMLSVNDQVNAVSNQLVACSPQARSLLLRQLRQMVAADGRRAAEWQQTTRAIKQESAVDRTRIKQEQSEQDEDARIEVERPEVSLLSDDEDDSKAASTHSSSPTGNATSPFEQHEGEQQEAIEARQTGPVSSWFVRLSTRHVHAAIPQHPTLS